jgi:hypothetical protein
LSLSLCNHSPPCPWGGLQRRHTPRFPASAPPRGLPSMSSTSVVVTTGPCRQHPQGARHRRFQLRWWPLLDLAASTPQGAHHRCLQLRWCPLPDVAASTPRGPSSTSLPSVMAAVGPCRQHPPGGLPSMSSTLVVAAAGPCRQHPPGGRHRRLQVPDLQLRHLSGPTVNVFLSVDGGRFRTSRSVTSRRPTIDCQVKSSR